MVDGKTILITGCGSLAKALTGELLLNHKPKKVILYSRDEFLQHEAKESMLDPRRILRFFIGDVRDRDRLSLAMKGVDIVIHAAALKRVDTIEYNPGEAVKTNVDGTQNVIRACIGAGVKRAIFTSTDKAVEPINLYGCTKAVAEKLWLHANFYKPIFTAVRYGNVIGSRGSVLPAFQKIAAVKEEFPITDVRMTRFWVDMDEAVALIIRAIGGEPGYIYVLKSPTFKITGLAKALYGRAKIKEVGLRPGEKIHETLISRHEGVIDRGSYYMVESGVHFVDERPSTQNIPPLTSETGNMSIGEIRELLKGEGK